MSITPVHTSTKAILLDFSIYGVVFIKFTEERYSFNVFQMIK